MSSNDAPIIYTQTGKNFQLNNEQIHALLNKLSSDEQKELQEVMKTCTTEVTMTRGIPITAAVLGSLWFSRQKLPPQYHFGPKGWPFYAIMGVASLTATNLLFMGICRDRVQPRIDQLWSKYQMSNTKTSYDEIRRQNRGKAPQIPSAEDSPDLRSSPDLVKPQTDYTTTPFGGTSASTYHSDTGLGTQLNYDAYPNYTPIVSGGSEFSSYGSSSSCENQNRPRRPAPPNPYLDDSSFISGTPSGPPQNNNKGGYFS